MAISLSKASFFSLSALLFLFLLSLLLVSSVNRSLSLSRSLYRDLWSQKPSLPNNPIPLLSVPSSPISKPVSLQISQKPQNVEEEDRYGFSDPIENGTQAAVIAKEEAVEGNKDTHLSGIEISGKAEVKEVNLDKKCDLYYGTWVKDEGYPLYQMGSCPYIDDAFTCHDNGRPDSDYTKWRWKPRDCDIPRFNATDFLERIRGKRLMLVGDSLNRNQFESLLCLLHETLPNKSRMYETRGSKVSKGRGYFIFKFEDYDCTVEFCRSHYLVKEGTRLITPGKTRPTLSIDLIDKSSNRWKRADILIFNTGHWWTHGKTSKGKDYYKEGNVIYPQFDPVEAYRRAMRTWGRWIDENLNPSKKLVFYRGYSSAHFRGGDWDSGGSCNGEEEPIMSGPFLDSYPPKMRIVEEVIREMKFPVILLNVTRLTSFRKDGHPSIYRKTSTKNRKVSTRRQDCSHWCLPGVPDAWNELIYANLAMQQIVFMESNVAAQGG